MVYTVEREGTPFSRIFPQAERIHYYAYIEF